jgi:hypothetical protein
MESEDRRVESLAAERLRLPVGTGPEISRFEP